MTLRPLSAMLAASALVAVLAVPPAAFADIWRVDANTAQQADFRTLQEAHDDGRVSSGDTLMIAGFSGADYGALLATKQLVIIGPGYFLDENPDTRPNTAPATTGALEFVAGSEGSVVSGMTIPAPVTIRAEAVTLMRNHATNPISVQADRAVLLQNYVGMDRVTAVDITDSKNVIIAGNFIAVTNLSISALYAIQSEPTSSAQVTNNVLATADGEPGLLLHNAVVENNILRSGNGLAGTGNTARNNLASREQFGTEDGNQANVDMSAVFVGPEGNSTDGQWQLRPGSPAFGAGVDGADAGMFGGAAPYVLSGLPDLPRISVFSAASVGSAEDGLQARVEVRAGQ